MVAGVKAVLTDRQWEVLRTYIDAGTAKRTGDRLGLSEQTVKNTLLTIRKKAGTRNTLQAVYKLIIDP